MPRKPVGFRLDEELWARVVARAEELGQTYTMFVERALEQALGEPHRAPSTEGIGTSGENPAARGVPGASGKPASAPARAPEPARRASGKRVDPAVAARMAGLNKAKGL